LVDFYNYTAYNTFDINMITTENFTNYNRTQEELEELLIFSIMVANKPADRTAKVVDKLLKFSRAKTPFGKIRSLIKQGRLEQCLRNVRAGQYQRISRGLKDLVGSNLDLKNCSIQCLENIYGIGPKTSRMFILHTRPKQKIAVLDTHILKYLKTLGHIVPKSTPIGKKYLELENKFLDHAKQLDRDVADLDLEIWKSYAYKTA
jgi:thermostable 8-oxoguanine DNA glycosylase